MQKTNVIGVDVSKKTLDVCLMGGEGVLAERRVANTVKAVRAELRLLRRRHGIGEDTVVCAEHTGQYTFPLCLENPMQIKLSVGLDAPPVRA